jgi:hypothetical protein
VQSGQPHDLGRVLEVVQLVEQFGKAARRAHPEQSSCGALTTVVVGMRDIPWHSYGVARACSHPLAVEVDSPHTLENVNVLVLGPMYLPRCLA